MELTQIRERIKHLREMYERVYYTDTQKIVWYKETEFFTLSHVTEGGYEILETIYQEEIAEKKQS